jgi:hypothetical protein
MRVSLAAYKTPKAGNGDDEYEDAHAKESGSPPDPAVYRVALADGATESSFAKSWAELLTAGAIDGRLDLAEPSSLVPLQREWDAAVSARPLPWFAEEKARLGAFAALVVLELFSSPHRMWRATAVGDCCVFHLRANELRDKFPLEHSTDFDTRPFLIGSRSDYRELVAPRLGVRDGTWEAGDEFLLMSDALAQWFLSETEAQRRPHEVLARLPESEVSESFREWVDELRRARRLRNDDTTLLRVVVAE